MSFRWWPTLPVSLCLRCLRPIPHGATTPQWLHTSSQMEQTLTVSDQTFSPINLISILPLIFMKPVRLFRPHNRWRCLRCLLAARPATFKGRSLELFNGQKMTTFVSSSIGFLSAAIVASPTANQHGRRRRRKPASMQTDCISLLTAFDLCIYLLFLLCVCLCVSARGYSIVSLG
jgi:hypothetical protein